MTMRRGAVLLFSLIVMSITVIVTGALTTYYVNTANVAKFYRDVRSSRRVGASRALRNSMDKVMEKLLSESGSSQYTPEVGINIQGKTMTEVLNTLKSVVPATTIIEDEQYELNAEIDNLNNALKITASCGGIPVMSTTIEFEMPSTQNTLEVFDYVYFADNNGQLNSSYIIVNGDVGSNGNFDLNGATINGYLRYLNNVNITGESHAWLQSSYNAKISSEFRQDNDAQNVIEQARPTNPLTYTDSNNSLVSVPWDGGYEVVYAKNPYTWEKTRPEPLEDPTSREPSHPPDYYYRNQKEVDKNAPQPATPSSGWEKIYF